MLKALLLSFVIIVAISSAIILKKIFIEKRNDIIRASMLKIDHIANKRKTEARGLVESFLEIGDIVTGTLVNNMENRVRSDDYNKFIEILAAETPCFSYGEEPLFFMFFCVFNCF